MRKMLVMFVGLMLLISGVVSATIANDWQFVHMSGYSEAVASNDHRAEAGCHVGMDDLQKLGTNDLSSERCLLVCSALSPVLVQFAVVDLPVLPMVSRDFILRDEGIPVGIKAGLERPPRFTLFI